MHMISNSSENQGQINTSGYSSFQNTPHKVMNPQVTIFGQQVQVYNQEQNQSYSPTSHTNMTESKQLFGNITYSPTVNKQKVLNSQQVSFSDNYISPGKQDLVDSRFTFNEGTGNGFEHSFQVDTINFERISKNSPHKENMNLESQCANTSMSNQPILNLIESQKLMEKYSSTGSTNQGFKLNLQSVSPSKYSSVKPQNTKKKSGKKNSKKNDMKPKVIEMENTGPSPFDSHHNKSLTDGASISPNKFARFCRPSDCSNPFLKKLLGTQATSLQKKSLKNTVRQSQVYSKKAAKDRQLPICETPRVIQNTVASSPIKNELPDSPDNFVKKIIKGTAQGQNFYQYQIQQQIANDLQRLRDMMPVEDPPSAVKEKQAIQSSHKKSISENLYLEQRDMHTGTEATARSEVQTCESHKVLSSRQSEQDQDDHSAQDGPQQANAFGARRRSKSDRRISVLKTRGPSKQASPKAALIINQDQQFCLQNPQIIGSSNQIEDNQTEITPEETSQIVQLQELEPREIDEQSEQMENTRTNHQQHPSLSFSDIQAQVMNMANIESELFHGLDNYALLKIPQLDASEMNDDRQSFQSGTSIQTAQLIQKYTEMIKADQSNPEMDAREAIAFLTNQRSVCKESIQEIAQQYNTFQGTPTHEQDDSSLHSQSVSHKNTQSCHFDRQNFYEQEIGKLREDLKQLRDAEEELVQMQKVERENKLQEDSEFDRVNDSENEDMDQFDDQLQVGSGLFPSKREYERVLNQVPINQSLGPSPCKSSSIKETTSDNYDEPEPLESPPLRIKRQSINPELNSGPKITDLQSTEQLLENLSKAQDHFDHQESRQKESLCCQMSPPTKKASAVGVDYFDQINLINPMPVNIEQNLGLPDHTSDCNNQPLDQDDDDDSFGFQMTSVQQKQSPVRMGPGRKSSLESQKAKAYRNLDCHQTTADGIALQPQIIAKNANGQNRNCTTALGERVSPHKIGIQKNNEVNDAVSQASSNTNLAGKERRSRKSRSSSQANAQNHTKKESRVLKMKERELAREQKQDDNFKIGIDSNQQVHTQFDQPLVSERTIEAKARAEKFMQNNEVFANQNSNSKTTVVSPCYPLSQQREDSASHSDSQPIDFQQYGLGQGMFDEKFNNTLDDLTEKNCQDSTSYNFKSNSKLQGQIDQQVNYEDHCHKDGQYNLQVLDQSPYHHDSCQSPQQANIVIDFDRENPINYQEISGSQNGDNYQHGPKDYTSSNQASLLEKSPNLQNLNQQYNKLLSPPAQGNTIQNANNQRKCEVLQASRSSMVNRNVLKQQQEPNLDSDEELEARHGASQYSDLKSPEQISLFGQQKASDRQTELRIEIQQNDKSLRQQVIEKAENMLKEQFGGFSNHINSPLLSSSKPCLQDCPTPSNVVAATEARLKKNRIENIINSITRSKSSNLLSLSSRDESVQQQIDKCAVRAPEKQLDQASFDHQRSFYNEERNEKNEMANNQNEAILRQYLNVYNQQDQKQNDATKSGQANTVVLSSRIQELQTITDTVNQKMRDKYTPISSRPQSQIAVDAPCQFKSGSKRKSIGAVEDLRSKSNSKIGSGLFKSRPSVPGNQCQQMLSTAKSQGYFQTIQVSSFGKTQNTNSSSHLTPKMQTLTTSKSNNCLASANKNSFANGKKTPITRPVQTSSQRQTTPTKSLAQGRFHPIRKPLLKTGLSNSKK